MIIFRPVTFFVISGQISADFREWRVYYHGREKENELGSYIPAFINTSLSIYHDEVE